MLDVFQHYLNRGEVAVSGWHQRFEPNSKRTLSLSVTWPIAEVIKVAQECQDFVESSMHDLQCRSSPQCAGLDLARLEDRLHWVVNHQGLSGKRLT